MTSTVGRVKRLTPEEVNSKLRTQAEASVAYYANHPEEIGRRLRELDEEWDIERTIEMEAAGTILTGVLLGTAVSRKWFLLPLFAGSMLLLHNLQGGYPLLPLLRRMGFRTAQEIAQERYALKLVRGDFKDVDASEGTEKIQSALAAAEPDEHSTTRSAVPI